MANDGAEPEQSALTDAHHDWASAFCGVDTRAAAGGGPAGGAPKGLWDKLSGAVSHAASTVVQTAQNMPSLEQMADSAAKTVIDAGADLAHKGVDALPAPEIVKGALHSYVKLEKGVAEGVYDGVKDLGSMAVSAEEMVTGVTASKIATKIGKAVVDPKAREDLEKEVKDEANKALGMAKFAAELQLDPVGTAIGVGEQVKDAYDKAAAKGEGEEFVGKAIGKIGVAVASIFVGGEAADLAEAADAIKAAEVAKAAAAAKAAEEAAAAAKAIEEAKAAAKALEEAQAAAKAAEEAKAAQAAKAAADAKAAEEAKAAADAKAAQEAKAAEEAKKAQEAAKKVEVGADGYTATNPPMKFGHMAEGEINANGKAVGYHSRVGGVDPPGSRVTQIVDPPDTNGVYTGRVEIKNPANGQWVPKNASSTFFPDKLSEKEIEEATLKAFQDSGVTQNGKFTGNSGLGFKIQGWFRDGKIVSAYPLRVQP